MALRRNALSLVVVSHVVHRWESGQLRAYGPYVAELDEWAELFDELVIVAPEGQEVGRGDLRAFRKRNVRLVPLKEAGGRGWLAKAKLLIRAAVWSVWIWREMRAADVIHVRCPGNVGLVGAVLAPLAGKPMIAKYAGQWGSYPGEAWSFRFQRWLLHRLWGKGLVLVYTDRPEAAHLIPFFNAALTAEDLRRARAAMQLEREKGRVLFVGRLSEAKGADAAIRACAVLRNRGLDVALDVAGEGPERKRLEGLAEGLGLNVRFHGGLAFEEVLGLYEKASVLVLPSRTEGWPKVLAEAMAFGVPCVATRGGLNDWMLGDGRGLTVEYGDDVQLAEAVARLLQESPAERAARRERCAEFGQRYSLEGVREGIRRVLEERFGLRLPVHVRQEA